ncbi:MAG: hypothetical protein MJ111_02335 [Clostridia bacterium]|nr:hypothetical protein [Candidatus Limimonas egerieequi]MCQ2489377.1 hypothetical protein [Clostridia bacterium]
MNDALSTVQAVDPAAFLDEYTSVAVPAIILGLAIVGLVVMQIVFVLKTDNVLVWIAPIFLGVAGGFSSLATMSYYSSFETIAKNNIPYLDSVIQSTVPNFGAFSVTFLFFSIIFFSSIFISFVLAVIKAIKRRNQY